jgi:hypothetical protein
MEPEYESQTNVTRQHQASTPPRCPYFETFHTRLPPLRPAYDRMTGMPIPLSPPLHLPFPTWANPLGTPAPHQHNHANQPREAASTFSTPGRDRDLAEYEAYMSGVNSGISFRPWERGYQSRTREIHHREGNHASSPDMGGHETQVQNQAAIELHSPESSAAASDSTAQPRPNLSNNSQGTPMGGPEVQPGRDSASAIYAIQNIINGSPYDSDQALESAQGMISNPPPPLFLFVFPLSPPRIARQKQYALCISMKNRSLRTLLLATFNITDFEKPLSLAFERACRAGRKDPSP